MGCCGHLYFQRNPFDSRDFRDLPYLQTSTKEVQEVIKEVAKPVTEVYERTVEALHVPYIAGYIYVDIPKLDFIMARKG